MHKTTRQFYAGNYINLDFGHLAAPSSLDRQLREAFLAVTVDVEHFAKMKVLANAEGRGEDGYEIVGDFYASLNQAGRNAILGAMRARMQAGERRDAYAGDLIAHHIRLETRSVRYRACWAWRRLREAPWLPIPRGASQTSGQNLARSDARLTGSGIGNEKGLQPV